MNLRKRAVALVALAAPVVLATGCSNTTSPSAPPPAAAKAPAAAITQFYAAPGTIPKGGRTLICYGVEAAAAVRIEPAVEELTPSLARCIEVTPGATTTYKLTAANRAGDEVSQTVTVTVDSTKAAAGTAAQSPAGGLIQFFTAAQERIPAGGTATLCYGVKGAASVTLDPAVQALVPSERMCFQVRPQGATTYTLKATGAAGGAGESRTIRITVQ